MYDTFTLIIIGAIAMIGKGHGIAITGLASNTTQGYNHGYIAKERFAQAKAPTLQQLNNRDLQGCPPGLTAGVCDAEKLEVPLGVHACLMECQAAQCCQLAEPCSCSECNSYFPCLNLPQNLYYNGFEQGLFPGDPGWSTEGADGVWSLSGEQSNSGALSIKSPDLSGVSYARVSSAIFTTDPSWVGGILLLFLLATVQAPNDVFVYYVDDVELGQVLSPQGFEPLIVSVEPGPHTIKFQYVYNPLASTSPEAGTVFIDDVYLLPQDTSPPPEPSCSTLSIDYYNGFNLHFIIDENDAEELMPYSHFAPLKLSGTHDKADQDTGGNGNARLLRAEGATNTFSVPSTQGYYVSFYASKLGVDFSGQRFKVGRADIFTYAIDPSGRRSMVMVAAYVEVPDFFQNQEGLLIYKQFITDLALDSRTGALAYQHIFVYTFNLENERLTIAGGDLQDSSIELKLDECFNSRARFTMQFVEANSLAWRSPIDKNINFFNQDFIAASVQVYKVDKRCTGFQNINLLHQHLPGSAKLESIQSYGSEDKFITWKYDDSTVSDGTPYLTLAEKEEAINLKRQVFSDMWSARSTAIEAGNAEALLRLWQGGDSVFLMWELSEADAGAISNELNLFAHGLEVVPIKVVKGDPAGYFLALNVYASQIGGDPGGQSVRFEWSTFVQSQDSHHPYYIILHSGSSISTIDPVQGQVSATPTSLSRDGDTLSLVANTLTASIQVGDQPLAVEEEWIYANGRVYWVNGVFDLVYFDSDFILEKPKEASINNIELSEDFEWGHILGGDSPRYTFVYEEENNYVVSPWSNMDATNPLFYTLKASLFSGIAMQSAALVKVGAQEPLVDLTVYGSSSELKRILINYEIPPAFLPDFTRILNLPDGLGLAPMRVAENSLNRYIITLAVLSEALGFDYELAPPLNKVAWTAYIQDDDGNVYLNEFFTLHSAVSLDIVHLFREAAEVFTVANSNDSMDILVEDNSIQLEIKAPKVDSVSQVGLSSEWVTAHDRVYWEKGVYDKLYLNEQMFYAQLLPIDISKLEVIQKTPWMHLIEERPFEAFFFLDDVTFVSMPWQNIEEVE